MIERLQRALQRLEDLSPEAEEELADEIEEMASVPDRHTFVARATATTVSDGSLPLGVAEALALAGAWSDLQNDDEFEALDRIRHATPPTPSIADQLAWLDGDEE